MTRINRVKMLTGKLSELVRRQIKDIEFEHFKWAEDEGVILKSEYMTSRIKILFEVRVRSLPNKKHRKNSNSRI